MSARTFAEWQAYYSIQPFGPRAEYWRAALITSMIANVNRKKGQKPFVPEDFMPKLMVEQEPSHLSHEHAANLLRQNFEAYNHNQKVTGQ